MQPAHAPLSRETRVWVLLDEIFGHRNQSLGVAEALGLPFETRDIAYSGLSRLPNALRGASLLGVAPRAREGLRAPWPDLVIAAGRRLAPLARFIKRQGGGRPFLVQIMYPGHGAGEFDLIAAPRHDECRPRANLIETTGAPNRVSAAKLADEAKRWRDRFKDLPGPHIALLVGGATRQRAFDAELAAELGRQGSALARAAGGTLLVSTSRRTGRRATQALASAIDVPAHIHRWEEGGENPYYGFLGLSDAVIVTGDSMSMCSEACATGRPVYIFAPPGIVKPAFARLHQELFSLGMARPLGESFEQWTYPPLYAATAIAGEIRRRLGLAQAGAPASNALPPAPARPPEDEVQKKHDK